MTDKWSMIHLDGTGLSEQELNQIFEKAQIPPCRANIQIVIEERKIPEFSKLITEEGKCVPKFEKIAK